MPYEIRQHERSRSVSSRKVTDALLVLPSLFHSIYLNLNRQQWNGKTTLAIAAIIKNEGPYLLEWIEYHRSIGFQKFYLYDNESTDNPRKILAPYVKAGIVELTPWPGKARQMDAYNDALNKHARDCKYLAVIDLDEFINFGSTSVSQWLDQHITDGISGVGLNWLIFGSAGRKARPEGLVIESYTQRSEASFRNNKHTKAIVNPRRVLGYPNPHFAVPLLGYHSINALGEHITGPFSPDSQSDIPPYINHYFCKSVEEFALKRSRGMADQLGIRDQSTFDEHDRNDVEDKSMLPKAAEVHHRLEYLHQHGHPYGI